jgi:hypothetical protein
MRSWVPAVAIATLALEASAAPALQLEHVYPLPDPRREEVGLTLIGSVQGIGLEPLARCLAAQDRVLPRGKRAEEVFAGIAFSPRELRYLEGCSPRACEYELPAAGRARLERAATIDEKRRSYLALVLELTLGAVKRRKDHRVLAHELAGEPCASGELRTLLDGALGPGDALRWRKFAPSSRMQPTLLTFQRLRWQARGYTCIGSTLLFADHYYDDQLELFQLTPLRAGVQLRYVVRSRFDFFGSFWARRMKGRVTSGLRDHLRRELVSIVARCPSR